MSAGPHPLAELLGAAEQGRFPVADGGWHRVPQWQAGLGAVVAFTGHAVLALDDPKGKDLGDQQLETLGFNGLGGACDPRVMVRLAGPEGWISCLDQLFVARGRGPFPVGADLVRRSDLEDHPRVVYAAQHRSGVEVFGRPDPLSRTVVTLGSGVAGLPELGWELDPQERGRGAGAALVTDALGLIPAGELVVCAAAPGNAASVRAILRAGLRPVGSVQLFEPRHQPQQA